MNLTQRVGPLPLWVWGGLVAVAGWWFFLRKPAGQQTAAAPSAGSPLSSAYGLGFAQGQQASQAERQSAPGGATPGAQRPLWQFGQPSGNFVWRATGTNSPPGIQAGQVYPGSGGTPTTTPGAFPGFGSYSWQWAPVPPGMTDVDYAQQLSGTPLAMGGPPTTTRKHAIGARSAAAIWSDAHPLIGAPVRYAHYVRAVGGAPAHHSEVHRVAAQAGVHPARILMLNPHHTGRIRVA